MFPARRTKAASYKAAEKLQMERWVSVSLPTPKGTPVRPQPCGWHGWSKQGKLCGWL